MIREQVRELMDLTGMSQAELSRRACVAQPNISDFLSGKADVGTRTADRLIAVLEEAHEVMGKEDEDGD